MNWLLLLAYDGFDYHGWQIQNEHPSIEGQIEAAIETLTGTPTPVIGAGRTDAKVHAYNQTANFHSDANFSAEKWRVALNSQLAPQIVVKEVTAVSDDFHARHSAIAKQYRYLIYQQPYPTPFGVRYSWWLRNTLDLEAMNEAASHFLGEHDFSAFRASQCSSPSPVKTLHSIDLIPQDTPVATLAIDVKANSFLQHMVRIIVGTLVEVGTHRIAPNDLPKILQSRDRSQSGKTAPGHGLYVQKVFYS